MFHYVYLREMLRCVALFRSCSILRQATFDVSHSLILTLERRSYGPAKSTIAKVSLYSSTFI